jgi:Ca2+-binding RTX toxin-like protein
VGFDLADITVELGSISNLVQSSEDLSVWTAELSVASMSSLLPLTLALSEDSVRDVDGNGNSFSSAQYAVLSDSESHGQPAPTDDTLSLNVDAGVLYGLAGDDILLGSNGADTIIGNGDDDLLIGKEGDDRFIGASGDDIVEGGAGSDTYFFDVFELSHNYQDIFIGGAGEDTVKFVENITAYQIGFVSLEMVQFLNDLVYNDVTFRGVSEFDGFDELEPVIFVQKLGDDPSIDIYQSGYLQTEILEFGDVTLTVGDLQGTMRGDSFPTDDVITVLDNNEPIFFQGLSHVSAVSESISILGGVASDTLITGLGADNLAGSQGDDILISLAGNDSLYGDDGDDILVALVAYQDEEISTVGLAGGTGSDTFVISPKTAMNNFSVLISDFEIGSDMINIDGVFSSQDDGTTLTTLDVNAFLDNTVLDVANQEIYIDLSSFYDATGESFNGSGIKAQFSGARVNPTDINQDLVDVGLPDALQTDWWGTLLIDHEHTGII